MIIKKNFTRYNGNFNLVLVRLPGEVYFSVPKIVLCSKYLISISVQGFPEMHLSYCRVPVHSKSTKPCDCQNINLSFLFFKRQVTGLTVKLTFKLCQIHYTSNFDTWFAQDSLYNITLKVHFVIHSLIPPHFSPKQLKFLNQ